MSSSARLQEITTLVGHKDMVTNLQIADFKGKEQLCSSARDKKVLCWDLNASSSAFPIINEFSQHGSYVNGICIAKSTNKIISAGSDNIVRIFDLNANSVTKGQQKQIHAELIAVSINAQEKKIVTGSTDKSVCIWDINGQLIKEYIRTDQNAHSDWVTCIAFKPFDDDIVISGSLDGTLKIRNTDTGVVQATYFDGKLIKPDQVPLHDGSFGIKALSLTADGSFCAYGGCNGKVYLINYGDQTCFPIFETNATITALAFGTTEVVLACSTKETIYLWDFAASELVDTVSLSQYGNGVYAQSLAWYKNVLFVGLSNGMIKGFEISRN